MKAGDLVGLGRDGHRRVRRGGRGEGFIALGGEPVDAAAAADDDDDGSGGSSSGCGSVRARLTCSSTSVAKLEKIACTCSTPSSSRSGLANLFTQNVMSRR